MTPNPHKISFQNQNLSMAKELSDAAARQTVFTVLIIFYYGLLQPIWWIGMVRLWKRRSHPIFRKRQIELVILMNIVGFLYLFVHKPMVFLKESIEMNDSSYRTADIIDKIAYIFGFHISISMYLCRAYINYFDISFAKATEEGIALCTVYTYPLTSSARTLVTYGCVPSTPLFSLAMLIFSPERGWSLFYARKALVSVPPFFGVCIYLRCPFFSFFLLPRARGALYISKKNAKRRMEIDFRP